MAPMADPLIATLAASLISDSDDREPRERMLGGDMAFKRVGSVGEGYG